MLLYKFRDDKRMNYIEDILRHERLYCSLYKDLNDPFEGQFINMLRPKLDGQFVVALLAKTPWLLQSPLEAPTQLDQIDPRAPGMRVCSLTSDPSDVRLWSIYANSHKGLAIEIDTDGLEPKIHEVRYAPSLQVPDFTRASAPSIERILTRKTDHWLFESEWRILTESDYIDIRGRIRRVILGARASLETRSAIEHMLPRGTQIVQGFMDLHKSSIRFH